MTTNFNEQLHEARLRFGRILKLWRLQNNWTGQTAEDWAREAPDKFPVKILNSVWTGLELGNRGERSAPATFIALGLFNENLAADDFGLFKNRVTRDRITNGKPILHDDGTPWDAGDFFCCFIGELDPPLHLDPSRHDLSGDPARAAADLRSRFHAMLKRAKMHPVKGLHYLLSLQPRTPGTLAARAEDVLLGLDSFEDGEEDLAVTLDSLMKWWEASCKT